MSDNTDRLPTKDANDITFDSPSRVHASELSSTVWGSWLFPVVVASLPPGTDAPGSLTTAWATCKEARGLMEMDDTLASTAFVRHRRLSMLKLDILSSSSVVLSLQPLHPCIWHCSVKTKQFYAALTELSVSFTPQARTNPHAHKLISCWEKAVPRSLALPASAAFSVSAWHVASL